MTVVQFKIPIGIMVQDKYSGLKGYATAMAQRINGSIQVAVQPPSKEDSSYKPDATFMDEDSLVLPEGSTDVLTPWEHEFEFETGDRCEHRINGFVGIVTCRTVYVNKCTIYTIEGKLNKEGKEQTYTAWGAELKFVDKGLNAPNEAPVVRKRTGGPDSKFTLPD